jgi:hypothetical protein
MITREQFLAATGREPSTDDLSRANCPLGGTLGHSCCGWNLEHDKPQQDVGPLPTNWLRV